MAKVMMNDKGETVIELPVAKMKVAFSVVKGKHLAAIEKAIAKAQKLDPDISNTELMAHMASVLISTPVLTPDEVLELDGEDIAEVAKAMQSFRGIRALQG